MIVLLDSTAPSCLVKLVEADNVYSFLELHRLSSGVSEQILHLELQSYTWCDSDISITSPLHTYRFIVCN